MTIFLFPGQGAQAQGMGKVWAQSHPIIERTLDEASSLLGRSMPDLLWNTPDSELAHTENAQVALFVLSVAVCRALAEQGVIPDAVAGFSLGECSALCAAGALNFEQMLKVVERRGRLMRQAAESHNGGMSAILGLDGAAVEKVCAGVDGFVRAVNFNCPGQTVIAGDVDALVRAEEILLAAGASRAVRLTTPGAFHTGQMADAAEELRKYISEFTPQKGLVTIYANQTGEKVESAFADGDALGHHMASQMQNPVLWEKTVRNAMADGVERWIECGSGNTLAGFVKRIDRSVKVVSAENALRA